MRLPDLNQDGDLPVGVYETGLGELLARFGVGSSRRELVGLRLAKIFELAKATRSLGRFIVFGSFITDKAEPNDVDVFLLMDDQFDFSTLSGEAKLLFEHGTAQAHFGASVFWMRRIAVLNDEQTTIAHWQMRRDGKLRGIVDVVSE